jgi:hypothetical protein
MGLKSKLANKRLNSRLSAVSRDKKVFNLDTAKTAGILWEIDQEESFRMVENELRSAGIYPSGLCYFPQKKAVVPDGVQGYTRKQTSWCLEIPKAQLVEDFIHHKFDILIDLTKQNCFPMIFVTALSEATFKIGYAGNAVNYFDLNIEFGEQPETSQLARQILYYLKRINKTTIE